MNDDPTPAKADIATLCQKLTTADEALTAAEKTVRELEEEGEKLAECAREDIISADIIQAEVVQTGINRHGIWRDLDFIRNRCKAALAARSTRLASTQRSAEGRKGDGRVTPA